MTWKEKGPTDKILFEKKKSFLGESSVEAVNKEQSISEIVTRTFVQGRVRGEFWSAATYCCPFQCVARQGSWVLGSH